MKQINQFMCTIDLHINQCSFKTTINNFPELGIRLFNMLPCQVKSLDIRRFKCVIRNMLCDLCVYDVRECDEHLKSINTSRPS
jgi:hypothetical protein